MKKIFLLLLSVVLLTTVNLFAQEEDMNGEMSEGSSLIDKVSAGATLALIEPWGEPGSGQKFATGFGLNVIAQYDLENIVPNLDAEISFGFSTFSSSSDGFEATMQIIPIKVLAIYAITDINPSIGVFGFAGPGLNLHSWDANFPSDEWASQTVLGLNFGLGASYVLSPVLKANVRVGGELSLTSSRELNGAEQEEDYKHFGTPIQVGVIYKF